MQITNYAKRGGRLLRQAVPLNAALNAFLAKTREGGGLQNRPYGNGN